MRDRELNQVANASPTCRRLVGKASTEAPLIESLIAVWNCGSITVLYGRLSEGFAFPTKRPSLPAQYPFLTRKGYRLYPLFQSRSPPFWLILYLPRLLQRSHPCQLVHLKNAVKAAEKILGHWFVVVLNHIASLSCVNHSTLGSRLVPILFEYPSTPLLSGGSISPVTTTSYYNLFVKVFCCSSSGLARQSGHPDLVEV